MEEELPDSDEDTEYSSCPNEGRIGARLAAIREAKNVKKQGDVNSFSSEDEEGETVQES